MQKARAFRLVREGGSQGLSAVRRLVVRGFSRAQAAVELAMVATILTFALVVGIQFAVLGEAALALGQVNYQGARYAAVHSLSATSDSVKTYMLQNASPTISANSGSYFSYQSGSTPTLPCAQGSTVTVAVKFDATHLIGLPNPFMGVTFPTSLTSSETAYCEGGS